jgi:transcriptional regulator with XRE-family HTH domain
VINTKKLIKLRTIADESQLSVSRKIGVSVTTLHKLECGKNQNPCLDSIVKICEFYNISVFDFLDGKTAKSLFVRMIKEWVDEGVIDETTAQKIYKHTFI